MRLKGTVKWFDSKKGYGFISREDGQGDVFVHWTEIKSEGFKTLVQGEQVEFSLKEDQKGVRAVEVQRLSPPRSTPRQQKGGKNFRGSPRRER
ncbi:Cold shock-like protein [bacterium HR19]|nr:Cold shock-like protein [bacterium HR19]